jgi:hypothetical protein
MKMWSPMLFMICVNLAAFMLNASGLYPVGSALWISPSDMTSTFTLSIFAGVGLGGAIVGIIALITRQFVYATYALIIWIAGVLLPIAQWFLGGVPIMLAYLLPSELWFVTSSIEALMLILFFMFFVELFSQRQVT